MDGKVELLIIDPQNDFCDLPAAWRPTDPVTGAAIAPALPVAGAHQDMMRLARFIAAGASRISGITLTLDSHQRIDVAHPTFWRRADGGAVAPFTPITAAQVRAGEFQPRDDAALPRVLGYLDELERLGRYTLMVWPVHCEIGSWGHNVHPAVKAAAESWQESALRNVNYVAKGANPWTEHYSAVLAEVPDPDDPATRLNAALLDRLDQADRIVVAGQASSHCVRATVEHIAQYLPSGRIDKLILLADCMSPVAGFEDAGRAFLDAISKRGAVVCSSEELLTRRA